MCSAAVKHVIRGKQAEQGFLRPAVLREKQDFQFAPLSGEAVKQIACIVNGCRLRQKLIGFAERARNRQKRSKR